MRAMGRRLRPPNDTPERRAFLAALDVAKPRLIASGIPRRRIRIAVAERLGVCRRTVDRYVNGETSIAEDVIQAVAAMGAGPC